MASPNAKSAAALAAAAIAVGVGAYAALQHTGHVPAAQAPISDAGECAARVWVAGPCEAAEATYDDGGTDCTPGTRVDRILETVFPCDVDGGAQSTIPPGMEMLTTPAAIPIAQARRPSKAITARRLASGVHAPGDPVGPCIAGHLGNRSAQGLPDGGVAYGAPVTDAGIMASCDPRYVCLDPPCATVAPVQGGAPTWPAQLCHDRPDLCPDGGVP